MQKPEVKLLFNGYSQETDSNDILTANCTCTLIKGAKNKVIVDTLTAWDGEKLKTALINENLSCDDIDYVVCTHGHSDHIGCNYLFQKATHIVGFSISKKDKYFCHDFTAEPKEYVIDKEGFIKVIPTPGHTLQDVSVVVQSDIGTVVITGDLFEKMEDLRDDSIWKGAGSDNEELQKQNRSNVLEIADWIVPGHGPMFKV